MGPNRSLNTRFWNSIREFQDLCNTQIIDNEYLIGNFPVIFFFSDGFRFTLVDSSFFPPTTAFDGVLLFPTGFSPPPEYDSLLGVTSTFSAIGKKAVTTQGQKHLCYARCLWPSSLPPGVVLGIRLRLVYPSSPSLLPSACLKGSQVQVPPFSLDRP